jgi:hypothetical protein
MPRIRNIPNRYTQRELISELEDLGFAGTFDFLYSPLDKGTMSNVGYAFVNFKSHEYASKCIEAFHNYRFKRGLETFQLLECQFAQPMVLYCRTYSEIDNISAILLTMTGTK